MLRPLLQTGPVQLDELVVIEENGIDRVTAEATRMCNTSDGASIFSPSADHIHATTHGGQRTRTFEVNTKVLIDTVVSYTTAFPNAPNSESYAYFRSLRTRTTVVL